MNQKQKLELTWIGKGEQPKLEPRILIEDPDKSYGDQNTSNMLIYGDNLLALKALEQDYTGKIKCIYIDPPYNTGNAFEFYDDGLEHSIWLNLMKERLEILKKLLRDDGIIIVHIDDVEQAYLKVMMDEIFMRKNFVNMIAIQDSHPSGLKLASKDKTIIKTKSYMLVYGKSDKLCINPIYKKRDEWDTHFNTFIETEDKDLIRESLRDILIKRKIINKDDKIDRSSLLNSKFKKFCFENRDKIFQSTKEIPEEPKNISINNPDKVIKYIASNGEVNYALNGRRLSPLSKSIWNIGIDGQFNEDFAKLVCDFWDDVDFNNSQNEGGVKFPASKKPEYLIARILTMFSKRDEVILDSFLGSGTTAAVAQKMGRKWIGIELGDHCHTHCIPRLKKVCDGTDQGGISEQVGWQGGGGFKYYYLAPSLLKKDKYNNWIISEKYNAEMLAAAMAKHEGYKYNPDPEIFWKQGRSTEKDYIFTTTKIITVPYLELIYEEMQKGESLLICCKRFEKNCEGKFPGINLKSIPKSLFGKCEFGKEDYSLNIINMPADPDKPEFKPIGKNSSEEKVPARLKKQKQEPSLFDGEEKE